MLFTPLKLNAGRSRDTCTGGVCRAKVFLSLSTKSGLHKQWRYTYGQVLKKEAMKPTHNIRTYANRYIDWKKGRGILFQLLFLLLRKISFAWCTTETLQCYKTAKFRTFILQTWMKSNTVSGSKSSSIAVSLENLLSRPPMDWGKKKKKEKKVKHFNTPKILHLLL